MKKISAVAILLLSVIVSPAEGETGLEASIEMSRVYVGNPVYLYLTFSGASNISRPDVSPVTGLRISQVGSSTEMSVSRGAVSQSITYTYLVMPMEEGDYEIGPFYAVHEGQTYRADTVNLKVDRAPPGTVTPSPGVSSAPAQTAPRQTSPGGEERAPYSGRDVFLVMELERKKVYVNEVVPVVITLYVDGVGLRDIEYPVFSHEGFSAGETAKPQRRRQSYRGAIYDTLEFRQELFAIKEGEYLLGPARLNCSMITRSRAPSRRSSIFGVSVFIDDPFTTGVETYPITLESLSVPVSILPFPEEGRPRDFRGAVGDFTFEAGISSQEVRVGDPLTLTMRVGGYGSLDTVTAPVLQNVDDFKVYEPQVSIKDGKKVYEQVLIPRNADPGIIPAVTFSYFDPGRGRYETVTRGPFPIKVQEQPSTPAPTRMVAMPMSEHLFFPQEELGQDILHIKYALGTLRPKGGLLPHSGIFWAFQLLPVLFFGAFYILFKRERRIRTDRGYARALKARGKAKSGLTKAGILLKKKDMPAFYDSVNKVLGEYLADKLDLPKGKIDVREIESGMIAAGCESGTLARIRDVFSKCEMARYASSITEDQSDVRILEDVKAIIDNVEKMKSRNG